MFDPVGAIDGGGGLTKLAVGFIKVAVGGGGGDEKEPDFEVVDSNDELKLHHSIEWTSVLPWVDPENPTNMKSFTYGFKSSGIDNRGSLGLRFE